MSHFSLLKLAIKNPATSIILMVIQLILRELGGEIVNEVSDFYGNKMKVIAGIRNDVFRRGIGLVVEKGELKIVGDFFNVPSSEVKRFQQLVQQYYTAQAMATALKNMGYSVSMQKVKDKVFVQAVGV